MATLKIKKLTPEAILPKYQTSGSAGFDLCAIQSTTIPAGKWALVPTGLAFSFKEGYEVQVRPRSGLALQYGITLLNTPGTIDSDYRGEIKVIMMNLGEEDFIINKIRKSVTIYHDAMGGYSREPKIQMSCVCNSKEYVQLREFIKEGTFDCFIKVIPLVHVFGQNKDFHKLDDENIE